MKFLLFFSINYPIVTLSINDDKITFQHNNMVIIIPYPDHYYLIKSFSDFFINCIPNIDRLITGLIGGTSVHSIPII